MNVRLIVSATAAALLAVSTASFGQSGTSARPAGNSGSNVGGTPPAMTGGASNGSTGAAVSGSSAAGATASRCAALTGLDKDRCLKEEGVTTSGKDSSNMRPEGTAGSNTGGVPPRMGGSSSNGTTTR